MAIETVFKTISSDIRWRVRSFRVAVSIVFVFKTTRSDLRWRNGQIISILRLLPDKEFGINSGGKMYRVKFSDGMKHNVFQDEIDIQERLRHPVGCKSA